VEGLSGPSVCRRPREDLASTRRRALTSDRAAPRGTVGIDIAGPSPDGDRRFPYRELRPLVQQASDAGLGVTIHLGEEGGAYGIAEIREVVSTLRPDRSDTGSWPRRTRS
jgi:hypothetical protein